MKPTDKSFKILKIVKHPSKVNREFHYVFFKGDTGKSFRSALDPANRNFAHWKNLLKVGNVLTGINLKYYKNSWIVDADSHPRLDHYEPLPSDGKNTAPAKPDPVVVPDDSQSSPMQMQTGLFGEDTVPEFEARKAAMDLIRRFWNDGKQSIRDLQTGQPGHSGSDYWASIGGYTNRKRIPPTKIVVTEVNGMKCHYVFSLDQIYKAMQQKVAS